LWALPNYKDRKELTTPFSLLLQTIPLGATKIGGKLFYKIYKKDEIITFYDKNYKTTNEKILFGHSLGGLMSVYCLLMYPNYLIIT
jgi:hypothetical protein